MPCEPCNMRGGAYLAPLSYLNPSYREPSSSAGPHALYSEPGLARPSIHATGGSRSRKMKCKRKHKHTRRCMRSTRKGGFLPPPSLLGSFMRSAPGLAPAAGVTAYRMVRNYKGRNKTRKN